MHFFEIQYIDVEFNPKKQYERLDGAKVLLLNTLKSNDNFRMYFRAIIIWIGLFILAFVNGGLRELGIKEFLAIKEPLAHQLSCATGVTLWTIFVLKLWNWLNICSLKEAALIGVGWFLATFLFETFVLNNKLSWTEIFYTYDVTEGELWGLVLLWIGLMPIVLFKFKQKT